MPHLFVSDGHGTFAPDGKVDASKADADAINAETTAQELAYWATKPERFEPAYYHFPAEHLPLFGAPRTYRRSFSPTLHTFVNKAPGETHNGLAHEATVSTWTGALLGVVIWARVYGHNFGGRMVSLRVRGTNGAIYSGRASWDNGSVIRLRKVKR